MVDACRDMRIEIAIRAFGLAEGPVDIDGEVFHVFYIANSN